MSRLDVEQYRALVELAPTLIWRAGVDGDVDFVNESWQAFTGRRLEDEVGRGWLDGVHPHDRVAYLASYLEHVAQRRPFEGQFRLRRFDGEYRWIANRAVPFTDASGQIAGFIGSCVDLDEHLVRDVMYGADDFFELSLDNLCVAGLDGYFKRVNPAWTRTLGWSEEELMAAPSIDLVHPDDREATVAGRGRLRDGSTLGPLTNRYRCKDGSYRWFEWRSSARADRGLVYASARDITDQKLAEERLAEAKQRELQMHRQLVLADRMASVGTLAAGVAHEINNPLASVTANLAMILEELARAGSAAPTELSAELRALASEAQVGAERIRTIVQGLGTFSRAEEEQRVALDVRELLELSIGLTHNAIRHRARLVREYGSTPRVDADTARLGQVFINLLVNAAQAVKEGDIEGNEIRITTSTDPLGRAVIEVSDTGVGIAAAQLDRIFDPFFSTRPIGGGTGLGLSICHTIVTALDGTISVTSQEGKGTTFRVVLPPAPPAPPPAVVASIAPAPEKRRASVLVVDDEPAIGLVLRRVLRDHDVTSRTTAREALEDLASGAHFDIILSDLMMPEMSGMDFYDELTRRFPAAAHRVVFLSGGAFTPAAREFLARVSGILIDKPFDAQGLRELVERSVRPPRTPAPP